MTGTITVRDAVPSDRPLLVEYMAGLQDTEHALHANRLPGAEIADGFLALEEKRVAKDHGRVFVAEVDGEPAGFLLCYQEPGEAYITADEKPYGWIGDIFVAADFRGSGVAPALMAAAEDHFRAQGIKVVRLGVLHANDRARAAYAKLGFAPYADTLEKYL